MGLRNREVICGYLPEELVFDEILSRLPVKSLLRFKSVSKSWHHLIESQKFIKFHLKHSQESNPDDIVTLFYDNNNLHTLNYYPSRNNNNQCRAIALQNPSFLKYYQSCWNELGPPILVGSCNGLVCFAMPLDRYIVYNPSTRAFKELPKVKRTTYCYGLRVFSLFTYDRVNDDYKVFELFHYSDSYRRDNVVGVKSLIFSMKSNSWKTIDFNVPYYKHSFVVTNDSILRWVDRNAMVIRSFNLVTEAYDQESRPINGAKEEIDLLITGKSNVLEFVSWKTYGWTVLPIVREGDKTEVGISSDAYNKKGSIVTTKPWAESLVSLN